ncbi:MAG: hypothetical protein HYX69_11130 [Planctomycetia bacterium]|nr:hypothetical protein [Planctomycetia bacterium]
MRVARLVATTAATFALLGAAASTSTAQLVAQTGFNDASGINSNPPPDSPYKLNATIAGQGGGETGWLGTWTVISGPTTNSNVQSAVALEGDGALYAQRTTNTYRRFANPQAGEFVVEQYLRFTANSRTVIYQYGDAFGSVFNFGTSGGAQFAAFPDGSILVLDGTTNEVAPFTWSPDVWYKFTTISDVPTQTWRFFVNDVEYSAPDPLNFRGTPGYIDGVNYLAEVSGNGTYIDNVRITAIPEPATFTSCLIAAGALIFGYRALRRGPST